MSLCHALLCWLFLPPQLKTVCVSLRIQSSIKPLIHVLLHIIYTKSRNIIIFVRFHPYCFFFLSLYPWIPAQILRQEAAMQHLAGSVWRVIKRSPTKLQGTVVIFGPPTLPSYVRMHRKKIEHSGWESKLRYWEETGIVLVSMGWSSTLVSHQKPSAAHETKWIIFTWKNSLLTSDRNERDGNPQQPVMGKLQMTLGCHFLG